MAPRGRSMRLRIYRIPGIVVPVDVATRRSPWFGAAVALTVAISGSALLAGCGGDGGPGATEGQTIRFQKATATGPDPFVKRADVRGPRRVDVGSGPFGGTGSDLVCDRELLIRSLAARPNRLAEWARVLDVEPSPQAVARYIRSLKAVTLSRDTRVTNHSFVDGEAVAYQAILQAGTAVLVNERGVPVARCRCGNPLLKPVFIRVAKCLGCPPDYQPPPPCRYLDFRGSDFYRLSDQEFLARFRPRSYRNTCYLPYPDPPGVKSGTTRKPRAPGPAKGQPATGPSAYFSPAAGTADQSFTLIVSGFAPKRTLAVSLRRPDGKVESYSITTGSDGGGRRFFPAVENPALGTYSATITDPRSRDRATASARVDPSPNKHRPDRGQEPGGGALQCNPPRSQLEFEQCRDREQSGGGTDTEGSTTQP
jgi:hypothetical protein